MNSFTFRIVILALISLVSFEPDALCAQPEANPEQPSAIEVPEFQPFDFVTAGFSFGFEQRKEPVIREESDGSTYTVTIQRRALDEKAFWTDGTMPFLRLTQSVNAVDDVSAVDDVLKSTIRDAVQRIDRTFGKRRDRQFSDCNLEILGELRFGKRIDVELLPSGAFVYVECYAFQDEHGNAIGVTLKMREPAEDKPPHDAIWSEEILSSLQIHDLQSDSYCLQLIGGYPLRIPVSATIQGTRRVNNFITETGVAFEHGTARIQTIRMNKNQNPYAAARAQLEGFRNAVEQQATQGLIEVDWVADIELLGGIYQNGVVRGRANSILANEQGLYSTLFTAVDKRNVIVVNFIGLRENRSFLDEYANEFFARPMSSNSRKNSSLQLNSSTIQLPRELNIVRNSDASATDFILDTSDESSWDEKARSLVSGHGGHTHISTIESGFEQAHEELCAAYISLKLNRTAETQNENLDHIFDNSTNSYSTQLNLSSPDHDHAIRITSFMADINGTSKLVSAVATPSVHPYQKRIARAITGWMSESEPNDAIPTSFGSIGPIPEASLTKQITLTQTRKRITTETVLGTLDVYVTKLSPEQQSREDSELDEFMLRPVWNAAVTVELHDVYPVNSGELMEYSLDNSLSRMIEAIIGDDDLVRVIGARSGDQYFSVSIQGRTLADLNVLESLLKVHADSEPEANP